MFPFASYPGPISRLFASNDCVNDGAPPVPDFVSIFPNPSYVNVCAQFAFDAPVSRFNESYVYAVVSAVGIPESVDPSTELTIRPLFCVAE